MCVKNVCFSSSVKGCCEQNVNVDYTLFLDLSLFKKEKKRLHFLRAMRRRNSDDDDDVNDDANNGEQEDELRSGLVVVRL